MYSLVLNTRTVSILAYRDDYFFLFYIGENQMFRLDKMLTPVKRTCNLKVSRYLYSRLKSIYVEIIADILVYVQQAWQWYTVQ